MVGDNFRKLNPYSIFTSGIGVLFFGILLTLSVIFYKERILCFDPAFFLFKMIHYKEYSIELNRWGSLPSQVLPLLAIKNNFSLDAIVKLYSASFIIIYIIIFFIITLVLKNYKAGIALMLCLCIGFRHAFYYATAELYQGLALSVLLWALISPENTRNKLITNIISVFLIIWISFYHQLTLFAILFVLLVELIGNNRIKDKQILFLGSVTLVWYAIRIFLFKSSDYEQDRMMGIYAFFEHLPNLRYLPSAIYFKLFLKEHLFSISITITATLILLLYFKKFRLTIISASYGFIFLILILITYYQGESPLMYENYYTLFGFFIAILISYSLFLKPKHTLVIAVVSPLLFINTIGVYNGHYTLTKRINYLERLITNVKGMKAKKFLIYQDNFPWTYTWVSWALPFETLILSSLNSPDSSVTFIVTNDMNKYDSIINNRNVFLGPDWAITWFSSNSMNPNYFRLPSNEYEKLNTFPQENFFVDNQFTNDQITITSAANEFISDSDSFIVVPLIIENNSGIKIPSIPSGENPLVLSYHIYDESNNMVIEYGNYSFLEADLNEKGEQGLMVIVPKLKGKYIIEADLLNDNMKWWGINSRFNLIKK